MGVIAPNGCGIDNFKDALITGKSGIKYIGELSNYNFSCKVGGVPDIDSANYLNVLKKYDLIEADTSVKYAVLAGIEAWLNSGFEIPDLFEPNTNDDFGAIVGTCFGGLEIFSRKIHPFVTSGNVKKLGSRIIENLMPSGSAAALSWILALSNQTSANSSACSTGTEAVILACERIRKGKAMLMLAGGTEPYTPFCWAGFDSMRILNNKFNDNPEKASRPMSESAAGFVPAAGAGILILEELEHALQRNAKIYAEIIGLSANSGGQRNGGSMNASNNESAIKCIKNAISDAGIKGSEIDLISAHLTGTKADLQEIENWIESLNIVNNFPYINSPKSMTGHMIGAAGAVETIAAVLQLSGNFVHPSINCEDINQDIANIYPSSKIPQNAIINAQLNYVAKAGFGFGDVNSCIILKKYQ
jgi:3-oxoacyl-(acyl-carrier-protein) synthase